MSDLKRIRDFRAPVDDASAAELRRQLGQFESNVSDLGDVLRNAAMQRLTEAPEASSAGGLVVAPGQFQFVDTSTGTVSLALAKPKAKDAGTLVVLIDLGGAAGSIYIQGQECKYENASTAFLTVTTFAALIFCDGTDYWRLS